MLKATFHWIHFFKIQSYPTRNECFLSMVKYVVDINEVGVDGSYVAVKLGIAGFDVLQFSMEESKVDVP